MTLVAWRACNATPTGFSVPAFDKSWRCFESSTSSLGDGSIGKLFEDNEFKLVALYPSEDVYEVRLTSKRSGGSLTFMGVPHITSPNPKLFFYMEGVFDRERPSEAFIEVNDVSYLAGLPLEKDIVIKTRGEPSYLGFIARKSNVTLLPLEPKQDDMYIAMRTVHVADRVVLAFVLRDVQLSRDRQRMYGEALEDTTLRSIRKWSDVSKAAGDEISFGNIFELTKIVNEIWPGLDWRQVPADWFNPLRATIETGGKFTNEVVRSEKLFRDHHYSHLLIPLVMGGKNVLALAGRSHAFTLGTGLKCLLENR
jgi:hypothetical protein